ncbi:MAG: hypothetical protein MRK02_08270 [Candidatus Scalindua sp.]|nr:hypothetical protein [Candidatus Scalindua sp.]
MHRSFIIVIVVAIISIICNDAIFAKKRNPGLEKTPNEGEIVIDYIYQKGELNKLNLNDPKRDSKTSLLAMIKHPLFILILGSLGFPLILMYLQIRQKWFELKTELVQEMSRAVMTIIAKTDVIYEQEQTEEDLDELKKDLRRNLKRWKVEWCITGSKIHAYYPKRKNKYSSSDYWIKNESEKKPKNGKGIALNKVWEHLFHIMEKYQDDMQKYQEDLQTLINEEDKIKLKQKRKDSRKSILDLKYLLIKEVLDRKITGMKLDWPFIAS